MTYDLSLLRKAIRKFFNELEQGEVMERLTPDLEAIYQILPPNHGFRSADELGWYLNEKLAEDPNEEDLAYALADGERDYDFAFPLGRLIGWLEEEAVWKSPFALTGTYSLTRVELPNERPPRSNLQLSGTVVAPWLPGAVRNIERQAETVVGASLAVGVAERWYFESPGIENEAKMRVGKAFYPIDRELADAVCNTSFEAQLAQTELEQGRLIRQGLVGTRDDLLRPLVVLMGDNTDRGHALRHACSVFLRAYACWDPGETVFLCIMCLESLLLPSDSKEATTNRLMEAVAYLLGKSPSERAEYRSLVDKLYDVRSKHVHNGTWTGYDFKNPNQRGKLLSIREGLESRSLNLVKQVLKREIANTYNISM